MHPDFSAAKIGKKVRKLRQQIRYLRKSTKWDVSFMQNVGYTS